MTSDLYKTYLERMHYLYAEKLLDNEIYTQSSTQFLAKGANMQIGACRTDAPFVLAGTDPEKYEQYVAFGPIAPEGGEPGSTSTRCTVRTSMLPRRTSTAR